MNKLLVYLLAECISVATIGACSASDNSLPLRRDCIVQIAMDWPSAIATSERELLIDKIGYVVSRAPATMGHNYVTSLAIPRDARNTMYLQFQRNCLDRAEMANRILALVKENVPNSPPMSIMPTVVEPGPDTIDVWGPSWTDSP